jgi:hypothetical protein
MTVIINWKGCGKKLSRGNYWYYQIICLERLGKRTKTLRIIVYQQIFKLGSR